MVAETSIETSRLDKLLSVVVMATAALFLARWLISTAIFLQPLLSAENFLPYIILVRRYLLVFVYLLFVEPSLTIASLVFAAKGRLSRAIALLSAMVILGATVDLTFQYMRLRDMDRLENLTFSQFVLPLLFLVAAATALVLANRNRHLLVAAIPLLVISLYKFLSTIYFMFLARQFFS